MSAAVSTLMPQSNCQEGLHLVGGSRCLHTQPLDPRSLDIFQRASAGRDFRLAPLHLTLRQVSTRTICIAEWGGTRERRSDVWMTAGTVKATCLSWGPGSISVR